MTVCSTEGCGSEKIVARGLCLSCYHRARRRGTVERAYVRNTGVCSVEGCGDKSFAKNLCQKHYNQAEDPMKRMWKNIRSRYPGQFPEHWTKFDQFLADVPEKPEGAGQLRRIDGAQPWGKENMNWLMPVNAPRKVAGVDRRQYHSDYGKAWSDRKKYSIEPEQRAAMLEEQGGGCAICGEPETAANPHCPERKPRRLNIDHHHKTGKVRGLLCVKCNAMIGDRGARENPDILRAAIAYLERHQQEK